IYTTKDGLIDDNIFHIFEDSRGDIWITSFSLLRSGVTRWERATETFHSYTEAEGRPFAPGNAAIFGEDAAGNVWIAIGEQLVRYGAGHFQVFTTADGLPAGNISTLYCDRAGRLWIATGVGGLGRMDDPTAERSQIITYTMADGLSSNQILSAITEDRWGN